MVDLNYNGFKANINKPYKDEIKRLYHEKMLKPRRIAYMVGLPEKVVRRVLCLDGEN